MKLIIASTQIGMKYDCLIFLSVSLSSQKQGLHEMSLKFINTPVLMIINIV